MTTEIITDGWLKGEKIVDGVILDSKTGEMRFGNLTNEDYVDQLRRFKLVIEVSE